MSLIEEINTMSKNTLMEHLNIVFTKVENNLIEATMPVDERTFQPFKILHGGASLALAETIGSVGSHILLGKDSNKTSRGASLTANHIKAVRKGLVTGKAVPIHVGKTTHIWDIKIYDSDENLISIARLTNFIISKK
jgi:1,4-dihydroxy-2-naphthoyl-CoA hydrolase